MKAIFQSNKICVNNEDCHSLVVRYRNDANAFNFDYDNAPVNFYQQIRLGIFIRSNKFDIKEKVYRRHNGSFKNTGVTIDKKYSLISDQYDEPTLDALVVASRHSEFIVDSTDYSTQGEADVTDNEFNNLATVKLEIFEQEFNQSNVSC